MERPDTPEVNEPMYVVSSDWMEGIDFGEGLLHQTTASTSGPVGTGLALWMSSSLVSFKTLSFQTWLFYTQLSFRTCSSDQQGQARITDATRNLILHSS